MSTSLSAEKMLDLADCRHHSGRRDDHRPAPPLLDKATKEPNYRKLLEEEPMALTSIGNNFMTS
jgi:hypothetical protein